jgi:serine/threonine protein kinase
MAERLPAFDGFEIVRILGKGGMGTVYLARDQRLGRLVALKVLNATDLNEDRKARFLREARSAASIRHQNVATIYEVDETADGMPFIVMEYCEGETLSQRIRRRALDSGEFLAIARQIAAGVAAAHEKNIVHRDIKSANIIVETNGLAKILDFGLAKSLPRALTDPGLEKTYESATGHFFGTLHFISPEQAHGADADARSDLFSVGVVLYHMATGHLPFNADAPLMVLEQDSRRRAGAVRSRSIRRFRRRPRRSSLACCRRIPTIAINRARAALRSRRDRHADRAHDATTSRTSLGRTVPRPRWIRVAVTIVAALIVIIAIFIARAARRSAQTATSTAAPPPIRSMAVLPLRNIANSTSDEFLSVGLADALVTELQQIPSLQVRPTSAVLEFRARRPTRKRPARS